jgi:hypothetical protein
MVKVRVTNKLLPQRIFTVGIGLSLFSSALNAFDLDDKFSIGGIAALSGQCQELTEGQGASNAWRGSAG